MSDETPENTPVLSPLPKPGGKVTLVAGHNPKPFSPTNQPEKKGRKRMEHVRKLMTSFGKVLAPDKLRSDPDVKQMLDALGFKGTVNEVMIARLYCMAMVNQDVRAFKLIFDVLEGKNDGNTGRSININFIAPNAENNYTEDLLSDEWTISSPEGSDPKSV